ncbi:MAG: SRPBCC family protein, partial [Bdellovibrio sp.]|nr:SRPBCC family protein [Bdellovibrio sp.]
MFSIPYETQSSIVINKKPEVVFNFIADFNNWPSWSPWLILEPNCQYLIKGPSATVGHLQEWNGQAIGAGRMTLMSMNPQTELNLKLEFFKPWKTESTARFLLRPKGDSTEVTWNMKGSLPFFMFFMKKMMKAWIGNDFNRGLRMMKEKLETGKVLSKVDVQGVK